MKRFVLVTAIALVLGFAPMVHAALINNGGGLIYDTALNITWYDYTYLGPTGSGATLSQATAWAAGLTVGGTTAGSWSLPTTLPVNGSTYIYHNDFAGGTDEGFNISAPGSVYAGSKGSELAYLFYCELGNKGYYAVNGTNNSGWGLVKTGPFANLQSYYIWSSTVYGGPGVSGQHWFFDFSNGQQSFGGGSMGFGAGLAVHPGDVGARGKAFPGIIFDNFDSGGGFHTTDNAVAAFASCFSLPPPPLRAAGQFTVTGGDYHLSSITLPISFANVNHTGQTLRVRLTGDSANAPGTTLEVLSENQNIWPIFANPFITTTTLTSADHPRLANGGKYWIVTELTSYFGTNETNKSVDYRWFLNTSKTTVPFRQQQGLDFKTLPTDPWTGIPGNIYVAFRVEGTVVRALPFLLLLID